MYIQYRSSFIKSYKKRFSHNKRLVEAITARIAQFVADPKNPHLKTHILRGTMKGFSSFSVTGDIRIVYQLINEVAYFFDIGTHNQVY